MIPTVDDLKSAPLTHRFGDLFNPPGLTNFLGVVQVDNSLMGVRGLTFPPFSCSDAVTAALYLDGRYFPSIGAPVTFTWYPDRIVRTAECEGLYLASTSTLVVGRMAVLVSLVVENRSGAERKTALRLGLQGGVTKAVGTWNEPLPPSESDNVRSIDSERGAVLFEARHSEAMLLQGAMPAPDEVTPRELHFSLNLAPGASEEITFVCAVGETPAEAKNTYDAVSRDVRAEFERARSDWNAELKAIFTPGNDRYGGHLPVLETVDKDIQTLYQMGALGVIYFKRDTPYSVYGRAYDTLMPRYWQSVTFLWDYFLSSTVHALLDPHVMRGYLERWMDMDIYLHFGANYLTGGPAGNWYSVNDFAMISMAREYVRWTGDRDWLQSKVAGANATVADYLLDYATHWKTLQGDNGLADYGGINNLLECVSTYVHEVASLNAANVFNLRAAADMLKTAGSRSEAALREEAEVLLENVQKLYVEGRGYWRARGPESQSREVRHCYDLLTVLNTIPDDLTPSQKREMTDFFRRELQTPTWMRALSAGDQDAPFNVRPDHQWTGAYPAWPPETAKGLYRIGEVDLAFEWLKGLAKSANQGPFGQAHFAETAVAPEAGGARKAPPEMPYITDWACSSSGSWVSLIIESIFGVNASLNDGITASPQFGSFDPDAALHNLSYQGKRYHVTREGITT